MSLMTPLPPTNLGSAGPKAKGAFNSVPLDAQRVPSSGVFHHSLKPSEREQPVLSSLLHAMKTPDATVNAHQLGRVEGGLKMAGGGMIALLSLLGLPNASLGVAEVLGFGGFFGTMAVMPKAVQWLVKQKTGLNQNAYYLSTQRDRRWLFQDVGYLPFHLIPEAEIQKVGDRLQVPQNLPNRRGVIEDRIRQITAQSQTLWMLLAGPATPLVASGLAHVLEQPGLAAVNQLKRWTYQGLLSAGIGNKKSLLQGLLNTFVGDSPSSDLSRWWPKVQQRLADESGLTHFIAQRSKSTGIKASKLTDVQWAQWLEDFLAAEMETAHPQHAAAASQRWDRLISSLKTFQEQVQDIWGGKAQGLLAKYTGGHDASSQLSELSTPGKVLSSAEQAKKQSLETLLQLRKELADSSIPRLDNANGLLNQVDRLEEALLDSTQAGNKDLRRTQPLTREALRDLLYGNNAGRMAEALVSGDSETVQRVLVGDFERQIGGKNGLFKWLGHLGRREFQKAEWTLGPTLASQLKVGAKQALTVGGWRRGVLGLLGGGLAVASGLYYALVLGKTRKPPASEFSNAEQMIRKYNQRGEFETLQRSIGVLKAQRAALPPRNPLFEQPGYLKSLFHQRQAVTYALNIRTYGSQDVNQDGLITPYQFEQGTFLSSIARLDELKALGVNNIHLLPINPIGTLKRKGVAGSIYAVADLHTLNPQLADPRSPLNVYEQARLFIQECHKRGIQVMIDIPSIASIDLAITRPDLIAVDEAGRTQTPTNWTDGVVFKNDAKLLEYYQGFFDLMVNDLGVDGFRADVARFRPDWFWKHFTSKYPDKAWVAETYTPEDASPLDRIPRDNPHDQLGYGFDAIYGQLHIFHQMKSGRDFTNYLTGELPSITHAGAAQAGVSPLTKSSWASYLTHDDETTPMNHGGVEHALMVANLIALTPNTTPYILDGQQTGYDKRIDIFNYTPAHVGEHPEIGTALAKALVVRKTYADVFANVSVPNVLPITGDATHQLFAWTLEHNGRKLLLIGNKTPNARTEGVIQLPPGLLPPGKPLSNLLLEYGRQCRLAPTAQGLSVSLGPSRILLFDVSASPAKAL